MAQAPRSRRSREDIRAVLLESALVEFGERGFDGASLRAIAEGADAHQPQLNYHFGSKEGLWEAAVDHLFGLLTSAMDGVPTGDPAEAFAEVVRRFVRFAAAHPELNRIIVHEATAPSERLDAMTNRHVRPLYDATRALWRELQAAGVAAPIDERILHYVLVGAASLLYVNAPEARLLIGDEPTAPAMVERHAEDLVATLLPGYVRRS
jgi:TetR/AcrR family transcriptional regulator